MTKFWIGAGLMLAALSAQATNGYFSHGYGVKQKGLAGAGIAFAQDSLTIATNPAGLTSVADGFEIGVDLFAPRRGASLDQVGASASYSGNDSKYFLIPEAGYSRHLNDRLAVGIALFGNGGMNTDYATNPFGRFGAAGSAGVDFTQAFVSPALALKLTDTQSLGVAVNLVYQRFEAKGIGLFGGFSSDPAHVSNNGYDDSTGWGVRLGWTGKFGKCLTLGATWQSKSEMGRFDKYRGLFADHGGFDGPETYGIGVALTPTERLVLALDWQRILYSDVPSVGNPVNSLFQGVPLGASDGPGFGWEDVSVVKLGASYQVSDRWTLRGGISHAEQPIPASQTFFNVLAPGTLKTHLTLGSTWKFGDKSDLSFSYLHALKNTVDGQGSIPLAFGAGEANVWLEEDSLGFAYSRQF